MGALSPHVFVSACTRASSECMKDIAPFFVHGDSLRDAQGAGGFLKHHVRINGRKNICDRQHLKGAT